MQKLECDDNKFLLCLLMYIMARQSVLEIELKKNKKMLSEAKNNLKIASGVKMPDWKISSFESDITKHGFNASVIKQFINECRLAVDNIKNGNYTDDLAELIQHVTSHLGGMESLAIRERFKELKK